MALSVAVFVDKADKFINLIVEKAKTLSISSGHENPDIGPVISKV